jgi:hypothetical protein
LARIQSLNLLARARFGNHVAPGAIWDEGSLILEARFFRDLADAIIDASFTFERDARPN